MPTPVLKIQTWYYYQCCGLFSESAGTLTSGIIIFSSTGGGERIGIEFGRCPGIWTGICPGTLCQPLRNVAYSESGRAEATVVSTGAYHTFPAWESPPTTALKSAEDWLKTGVTITTRVIVANSNVHFVFMGTRFDFRIIVTNVITMVIVLYRRVRY